MACLLSADLKFFPGFLCLLRITLAGPPVYPENHQSALQRAPRRTPRQATAPDLRQRPRPLPALAQSAQVRCCPACWTVIRLPAPGEWSVAEGSARAQYLPGVLSCLEETRFWLSQEALRAQAWPRAHMHSSPPCRARLRDPVAEQVGGTRQGCQGARSRAWG